MIVLDTHAWLWLASAPKLLSPRARAAVERSERIGICPISCWEIAAKVTRGRLRLDREVRLWVRQALSLPRVDLLPLDEDIAVLAGQLGPELPGDPADRLIAATALQLRAELVTKDRALRASKALRTIW